MSKDFPNERTCEACHCTFLMREGGPENRCKAHESLTNIQEEEVKYKYKDISNHELANRIQVLEHEVADLKLLVKAEKPSFTKVCEDCNREFQAPAPAVKKCPECKKKGK